MISFDLYDHFSLSRLWYFSFFIVTLIYTAHSLWFTHIFECVCVCPERIERAPAINKFNLAVDIVQPFFNSHTYATQFNSILDLTRAVKTIQIFDTSAVSFHSFTNFSVIDSQNKGSANKAIKNRKAFVLFLTAFYSQTFCMPSESIVIHLFSIRFLSKLRAMENYKEMWINKL